MSGARHIRRWLDDCFCSALRSVEYRRGSALFFASLSSSRGSHSPRRLCLVFTPPCRCRTRCAETRAIVPRFCSFVPQAPSTELRHTLVSIWARILSFDPSCQVCLVCSRAQVQVEAVSRTSGLLSRLWLSLLKGARQTSGRHAHVGCSKSGCCSSSLFTSQFPFFLLVCPRQSCIIYLFGYVFALIFSSFSR